MGQLTSIKVSAPCGANTWLDTSCGGDGMFGGCYRCDRCFAVIGSIGMPPECRELFDQEKQDAQP